MMDAAERKEKEYRLAFVENIIEQMSQTIGMYCLERDELRRQLSPVAAPVVEVEDEILAEEDYPRW